MAAASLQAEKYEILTSSASKPQKAFGLIFNNTGTNLINETNIKELPGQKDLYSVSFESDLSQADSFVSAILIDQDSKQSYSSVISAQTALRADLSKLPLCEAFSDIPDLNSQSELLSQLVSVRTKIRDHELSLIVKELDDISLALLSAKEKELGLNNSKALSASIPAEELNMRLFKLLNAISNQS